MPRLLPRLIKKVNESSPLGARPRHLDKRGYVPRRRKSLYQPAPERPSFGVAGRTQSILLDDSSPVTNSRLYVRHKTLPPCVHVSASEFAAKRADMDVPREMTTQEREWWSSPYLRMLSSPLRRCAVSHKCMPNDFLIRLTPLQLPVPRGAKSIQVWMPDGLEHPKFKRRKGQSALYITCWKDLFSAANINRIGSLRTAPNAVFHSLLAAQIGHLLRVRITQELRLLAEALSQRTKRSDPEATILRRLTFAEFRILRETGTISHPDAVAVLVVPPVNRDPTTREKPIPSMEPEIATTDWTSSAASGSLRERLLPPLSTLYGVQPRPPTEELEFASLLPNTQVPLYNGLTMFPSAPQRAFLHKALCEVLEAERRYRLGRPARRSADREPPNRQRNEKASHAFLLTSNTRTVERADPAALAIALWRLRMWEGDPYHSTTCSGGWEVDGEWRSRYIKEMQ
ncbi:hypothetical protein ID866_2740 [Astraeus odoratus]|nr:hypothetical protein ID866_2740 [Astraeus odoratus]